MVHDDGPIRLGCVRVSFDDERVVSDAEVTLVATLAKRLGLEGVVMRCVPLRDARPGVGNAGRKVMALIFATPLDADCINDCDPFGCGHTRRLLAG